MGKTKHRLVNFIINEWEKKSLNYHSGWERSKGEMIPIYYYLFKAEKNVVSIHPAFQACLSVFNLFAH